MDNFLKKSVQITVISAIILSSIFALSGRLFWGLGLLAATAWCIINFLLTVSLVKIAVLEKVKHKLNLLLLIKFPVLYLLGFLILVSKVFPVSSLLVGLSLFFIVMGILKICPKPA